MDNTKGKLWKKILLTILIILILIAAGVGGLFFFQKSKGTFLKNTILNGYDVSDKSPEEVLDLIQEDFNKIQVILTEQGETDLSCQVSDLGFYIEKDVSLGLIKDALSMQTQNPFEVGLSLWQGLTFKVDIPCNVDETVFNEKVKADNLAVPRTANVNAKLKRKKNGDYKVTSEKQGTEFVDENLQYEVRSKIGTALANVSYGNSAFTTGKIEISFPEKIYLPPEITSTDPELNLIKDVYNRYCQAEITYQYGSQSEVLGWDTLKDWIIFDDGDGYISAEKAWEYVENIAIKYNTRYHDRTFTTTYGNTITFPGSQNEYGYTVNQDAEYARLLDDIAANTKTSREPVYYKTNSYDNPYYYRREGTNDLAGSYVEVNLSAQHLWFYKNGSLVIETDLVSGCVAKQHETTTGVYPLAYKKSPDVLVGSNANDGYRTEVQYWMPFYEGQGLHDATWRSSFGGNIYQTNGSHGCVNLPLQAAGVIYENIEPGVAIILYK